MRDEAHPVWNWRLAAIFAAALALTAAAATVQRDRYAKAKRLGVSVLALSNPDRLMKRLRSSGGL